MSDWGLFEAATTDENDATHRQRTAVRKVEAAVDAVREQHPFLMMATGLDEFNDRWRLALKDIRATVEAAGVFPAAGPMGKIERKLRKEVKASLQRQAGPPHGDKSTEYFESPSTLTKGQQQGSAAGDMDKEKGSVQTNTGDGSDASGNNPNSPASRKDPRGRAASRHTAGESVEVSSIPNCDICQMEYGASTPAEYDGKTQMGPWANMCKHHFKEYGVGLGTGRGQKLVLRQSMRKGAPFANYKDFEDCLAKNKNKNDPSAYCGYIKHRVEDSKDKKESARTAALADQLSARDLTAAFRELALVSPEQHLRDMEELRWRDILDDPEQYTHEESDFDPVNKRLRYRTVTEPGPSSEERAEALKGLFERGKLLPGTVEYDMYHQLMHPREEARPGYINTPTGPLKLRPAMRAAGIDDADPLIPEGDFEEYLDAVSPQSRPAAERNFSDTPFPGAQEHNVKGDNFVAMRQYASWCRTAGVNPRHPDALELYSFYYGDRDYPVIATALRRLAEEDEKDEDEQSSEEPPQEEGPPPEGPPQEEGPSQEEAMQQLVEAFLAFCEQNGLQPGPEALEAFAQATGAPREAIDALVAVLGNGESQASADEATPPGEPPAPVEQGPPPQLAARGKGRAPARGRTRTAQPMPPGAPSAVSPAVGGAPAPIEDQAAENNLLDTAMQAVTEMRQREQAEFEQITQALDQAQQALEYAISIEQAEHPMDVQVSGGVDVRPPGPEELMAQQGQPMMASREAYSRPFDQGTAPKVKPGEGKGRRKEVKTLQGPEREQAKARYFENLVNQLKRKGVSPEEIEELVGLRQMQLASLRTAEEYQGSGDVEDESGPFAGPHGSFPVGTEKDLNDAKAVCNMPSVKSKHPGTCESVEKRQSPKKGSYRMACDEDCDCEDCRRERHREARRNPMSRTTRKANGGKYRESGYGDDSGIDQDLADRRREERDRAHDDEERSRESGREAHRKQAWPWITQAPARKVAGWEFDDYLNGYIATAANNFTCDCGASFDVPAYYSCKTAGCGKTWNAYVVGYGGDHREAAVDKYICREVPAGVGIVLANKTAAQECEYCGERGHDFTAHPEALADIREWERERNRLEFPFGDHSAESEAYEGDSPYYASRRRAADDVEDGDGEITYDGDRGEKPKGKVPSTEIKKPPADWAKRSKDGTWTGPAVGAPRR